MTSCTLRPATPDDLTAIHGLIMEHGPNQWNWLPEDGVASTLDELRTGLAGAVVADNGQRLLGALVYRQEDHFPHLRPHDVAPAQCGFLVEAVVSREAAGQGLGTRLMQAACDGLATRGITWITADRHEENAASAGMMRRAGLVLVSTFDDPERRPHGSRRTSVCAVRL